MKASMNKSKRKKDMEAVKEEREKKDGKDRQLWKRNGENKEREELRMSLSTVRRRVGEGKCEFGRQRHVQSRVSSG